MYCTGCGRQVGDGARFCPYCGTALAQAGGGTGPEAGSESPIEPEPVPKPEPGPAVEKGAEPEPAPARRVPVAGVVAALVLVLVVVVGVAAVVLLGGDGSDTTADADGGAVADDEAATEAAYTVAYYGTDDAVRVGSSTVIVLYDDEDEPLEDYDLLLMAEDGTALTRHVEGGSFTPEGAEIPAGEYAVVVRDAASNEVHTVPALEVVDETGETDADDSEEADDGDEADSADDALPETIVIKVPDADADDADETGDATDETGATPTDQQLAYLLYYQRVVELQELYGEAALDEDADGAITVGGVSLVLLVDIDADGLEELVVVWDDEGGWGAERTVEVWRYDAETGAIECVCAEAADTDGLTFSIELLAQEDGCTYVYWYWASYDGDLTEPQMDYVVVPGEDGALELHTCATTWDDDAEDEVYYLDGVEGSWTELYDFYFGYLYTYVDKEIFYLYVWYDDGSWDYYYEYEEYVYDSYAPATTLAYTQATVEELRSSVEALFSGASAEDEEEDASGTSAEAYAFYYETILELQEKYGTCEVQTYSSAYGSDICWYSGVCFAALLDFDGDGSDELLVIYNTDDPAETTLSESYAYQIIGYNSDLFMTGGGIGFGDANGDRQVYVSEVDGRAFLIKCDSAGTYNIRGYCDEHDRLENLLLLTKGSGLKSGDDYSVLDEDFDAAYETYLGNATCYTLRAYADEFEHSAMEALSETLALLEEELGL